MTAPEMPHNLEAEQSTLGSILLNPAVMADVAEALTSADDFHQPLHREVYGAMLALHGAGQSIDPVTLGAHLGTSAERSAYLVGLAASTPTWALAREYAKIVREQALRRRAIAAGEALTRAAYGDTPLADVVSAAEGDLLSLAVAGQRRGLVHIRQAVSDYLDVLDARMQQGGGALAGVVTDLADLDRLLGGLHRGDLIVLGARPAMGKSSMALSMVYGATTRDPQARVVIFTLEMSAEQFVQRLLCIAAGLDLQRLRLGYVDDAEWTRLIEAAARLAERDIYIDDGAQTTTAQMRSTLRRLHARQPLDLVVVDYLQLMAGKEKSENRVQEVSKISRDLKGLARELEVPLLALSQVSRAVDSRPDHTPLLSDLRESGAVEQDSDVVLFLVREVVYNHECENPHGADLIVAKHRNGPTGQVALHFNAAQTRFVSSARPGAVSHHSAAPPPQPLIVGAGAPPLLALPLDLPDPDDEPNF